MDNYYKILGVKNFATLEEIKVAYRKLSKKLHPDVNDGDKLFEDKFKELQVAYEILSASALRDAYDKNLGLSFQNSDVSFQETLKEGTKSQKPASTQRVRRESPYIFVKGRFIKRRRW